MGGGGHAPALALAMSHVPISTHIKLLLAISWQYALNTAQYAAR